MGETIEFLRSLDPRRTAKHLKELYMDYQGGKILKKYEGQDLDTPREKILMRRNEEEDIREYRREKEREKIIDNIMKKRKRRKIKPYLET